MPLKKKGMPQKIKVVNPKKKSALEFDPHLAAKTIKDSWTDNNIEVNQVHESLKSMGVISYDGKDMDHVIELLESTGLNVTR